MDYWLREIWFEGDKRFLGSIAIYHGVQTAPLKSFIESGMTSG